MDKPKVTKDSYNPNTYYIHWTGRILKIVGWYERSDCPYVVFLGSEKMKPRTWSPELREASDEEIKDWRETLANEHELEDGKFFSIREDGRISVTGDDGSVWLTQSELEKIVETAKKGRVRL